MDDCAGKKLLSVSLRNYLRVKDMYCIFEQFDLMRNLDYLLIIWQDICNFSTEMDASLVGAPVFKTVCVALILSQVGSIPTHLRHFI